jgi:hypothetical protein
VTGNADVPVDRGSSGRAVAYRPRFRAGEEDAWSRGDWPKRDPGPTCHRGSPIGGDGAVRLAIAGGGQDGREWAAGCHHSRQDGGATGRGMDGPATAPRPGWPGTEMLGTDAPRPR